jgi:hypothetical protein
MIKLFFRALFTLVCIGAVALLFYVAAYRPWSLTRGAAPEEVSMQLPGDEIVQSPDIQFTQAVTINAPKETVWAYLIQVGYKRAGWYNIDWINGLVPDYFYEGGKSADRIIPELQDLKQGDAIMILPVAGYDVSLLDRNKCLLLTAKGTAGGSRADGGVAATWVFYLDEVDSDTTRLITRTRSYYSEGTFGKIMDHVFSEAGSAGLQQPAMLNGLKKRAEAEYGQR